jgi:hypothetical protein
VIGDGMTAQRPELFGGESLATLPVLGDVTLTVPTAPAGGPASDPAGGSTSGPVAGPAAPSDAPAAPAAPADAPALAGGALAGLPLLGNLGSPTGGGAPAVGGAPTAPSTPDPRPAPRPAPTPRPAIAPKFADPAISQPADDTRRAGRHRAMSQSPSERPVAGEDPEFTESARVPELEAPALNLPLPLIGNLGNLNGLLGGAVPTGSAAGPSTGPAAGPAGGPATGPAADPAAAPDLADLGIDPKGGPVSRMEI